MRFCTFEHLLSHLKHHFSGMLHLLITCGEQCKIVRILLFKNTQGTAVNRCSDDDRESFFRNPEIRPFPSPIEQKTSSTSIGASGWDVAMAGLPAACSRSTSSNCSSSPSNLPVKAHVQLESDYKDFSKAHLPPLTSPRPDPEALTSLHNSFAWNDIPQQVPSRFHLVCSS